MNDTDRNLLERLRGEGLRSDTLFWAAKLLFAQKNVQNTALGLIAITKPSFDRRSVMWSIPSLWRDASICVVVVPTKDDVHSALDLARESGKHAIFRTDTLHVHFDLPAAIRTHTHIVVVVGPIDAILSSMYASMLDTLRRSHWLSLITLEHAEKLQGAQFAPYIPQLGLLDRHGRASCPVALLGVDASGRLALPLRAQLQTAWRMGRDVGLRVLDDSTMKTVVHGESATATSDPVRYIVSDVNEWNCREGNDDTVGFSTEAAAWMRSHARRCEDDERWMIVCTSALDLEEIARAIQAMYRVHIGQLATYVFPLVDSCDQHTRARIVEEWRAAKRSVLVLTTVTWDILDWGLDKSVRLIVHYGGSLRVTPRAAPSSFQLSSEIAATTAAETAAAAAATAGSGENRSRKGDARASHVISDDSSAARAWNSTTSTSGARASLSSIYFDPIALLNRHLRDARARLSYSAALGRGLGCASRMEFVELCIVDHGCKRKYIVCHIHEPKVHWVECSPLLLTHEARASRGEAGENAASCTLCSSSRQRVSIRFARTSPVRHVAYDDSTSHRDDGMQQ